MRIKETRHRLGLTLLVTVIISLFWVTTLLLTGWVIYLLIQARILTDSQRQPLSVSDSHYWYCKFHIRLTANICVQQNTAQTCK